MRLENLVLASARRTPDAPAVVTPDERLTYRELDALANRFARALTEQGVTPGDRVGLWAEKSARLVAAMQGILRLGAAYVPIDPVNPIARASVIASDCGLKALVTTGARAAALADAGLGIAAVCLDEGATGVGFGQVSRLDASPLPPRPEPDSSLAYVLYTSGSTGKPKGVCISHRNALAFVDWAHDVLNATARDVFANHAPFFFDLSVLDLYAAFKAGASVCLVPEAMAFSPARLVDFVAAQRISVWYSVPSALILMAEKGRLLEREDCVWRAVCFAGEPYPIKHLRALRRRFPSLRLLNLYGPTETNVCTWYEVGPDVPDERTAPVPIGKASCGDRVWMEPLPDQAEGTGELLVDGPTVMLGYWGLPPHLGPYRTGDLVRQEGEDYVYLGRIDNMLKVRGRRMEPQEIEAALLTHPSLEEAVVVAQGTGLEAKLVAFAVRRPGTPEPSLLELKRACAARLPTYMIIDELRLVPALPRTANGKVDRKVLVTDRGAPNERDAAAGI